MKIKKQVEMTHEEYAKYLIDKYGVSGFESELIDNNIIDAPNHFKITFELNPMLKKELPNWTFRNGIITVEVEETVTEETKLTLVERWKHVGMRSKTFTYTHYEGKSIKNVLFQNPENVKTTHFYTEIDGELVLIWTREKGLVE